MSQPNTYATFGVTDMTDDIRSTWTDSTPSHATMHSAPADQSAAVATAPAASAPANAASMPMKQIVTIRLDVDTLAWFKSAGPGYQTRINQLLREHMEAQQAQARNAA